MKLGTRLLLALLPTIGVVMIAYAVWALTQRQATVLAEGRRETEAYGRALAVGLEYASRALSPGDLRALLDDVSREPSIYGVALYSLDGASLAASGSFRAPPPPPAAELAAVRNGAGIVRGEREISGERVYTVVRPLRDGQGAVVGALEVVQPLAFVEQEVTRVGTRFVLNTLTLLLAVALLTLWLVRRFVSTPMERFVEATQALGRGELAYRLPPAAAAGELDQLSAELNRMAGQLDAARTQLLREADERVALERRLRESEKMASVGKLAAGLAHEIAAPLNVISGRAEMLMRREGVPPEQEKSLRIIVDQIRRISTIVRNLLDFGRRREPRRVPTNLARVVDGVLAFLDAEFARAGVTVEVDHPDAWLDADPDHLHQVLTNLLLNAIQALEGMAGDRRIRIRCRAEAGSAVLELADSGPGVPDAARDQIFEPFFTTKPAGTGLGLVVARSIAEEHGGSLDVVPAPERGARFRLTLPLARSSEVARV